MKINLLIFTLALSSGWYPGKVGTPLPEGFTSKKLMVVLRAEPPQTMYGELVSFSDDTLVILPQRFEGADKIASLIPGVVYRSPQLAIPCTAILRLASRKRDEKKRVYGTAIGLGTGVLIGAWIGSERKMKMPLSINIWGKPTKHGEQSATGAGMLLGALGGAVVGGIGGTIASLNTWQEIDHLNRQLQPYCPITSDPQLPIHPSRHTLPFAPRSSLHALSPPLLAHRSSLIVTSFHFAFRNPHSEIRNQKFLLLFSETFP